MLRVLIFAGLGVSTKSASGEGFFLSSVHSEFCKGAVKAGMVCKYCCTLAGRLTLKNKTFFALGPMGESTRRIPRYHKFQ